MTPQATSQTRRSLLLLAIQAVLVLSIAGKYAYERATRPRVWTRTAQVDPDLPLRGRYLALRLAVDGCGLPHDPEHLRQGWKPGVPGNWSWNVRLAAKDGHLVAEPAPSGAPPEQTIQLWAPESQGCERTPLRDPVDFFLDEHARPPLPLKPEQELWVEVTVPETGQPRPIRLAVSDASGFHPLDLR